MLTDGVNSLFRASLHGKFCPSSYARVASFVDYSRIKNYFTS